MCLPRWMLALALGVGMVAGCDMFNGDDDDDDALSTRSGDRYSDRYDSRGGAVIGNDRDSDRYDSSRTASGLDRDSGIPAGAQIVGEMDGPNITYRAREDGRVYIFDNNDQKLVWSGRLRDGERFVLQPGRHEATINGSPVGLPKLGSGHGFTLYFMPEEKMN